MVLFWIVRSNVAAALVLRSRLPDSIGSFGSDGADRKRVRAVLSTSRLRAPTSPQALLDMATWRSCSVGGGSADRDRRRASLIQRRAREQVSQRRLFPEAELRAPAWRPCDVEDCSLPERRITASTKRARLRDSAAKSTGHYRFRRRAASQRKRFGSGVNDCSACQVPIDTFR